MSAHVFTKSCFHGYIDQLKFFENSTPYVQTDVQTDPIDFETQLFVWLEKGPPTAVWAPKMRSPLLGVFERDVSATWVRRERDLSATWAQKLPCAILPFCPLNRSQIFIKRALRARNESSSLITADDLSGSLTISADQRRSPLISHHKTNNTGHCDYFEEKSANATNVFSIYVFVMF